MYWILYIHTHKTAGTFPFVVLLIHDEWSVSFNNSYSTYHHTCVALGSSRCQTVSHTAVVDEWLSSGRTAQPSTCQQCAQWSDTGAFRQSTCDKSYKPALNQLDIGNPISFLSNQFNPPTGNHSHSSAAEENDKIRASVEQHDSRAAILVSNLVQPIRGELTCSRPT